MATPNTAPPGAAAQQNAVSKTKLLRDLYADVQSMKQSIEPAVQVSAWVKDQFKPTMKKMKDLIDVDIQSLRTDLAATDAYAKNITQWIKDTIGVRLEKVTELLEKTVQTQLEKQAEEAKQREESLWNIFGAKFENYSRQMEQERVKMEAQVHLMAEEMKKFHAARLQMEQSHAAMKQTHEVVLKDARERPEQEIEIFRKLTKKLEEERKKIEEERIKMEEERKKVEEERKRFETTLDEERKRHQERQMIEFERKKLEDERRTLTLMQQQQQMAAMAPTMLAAPAAPAPQVRAAPVVTAAPVPAVTHAPAPAPVAATSAAAPEVAQWLRSEGFDQYAATFAQFGYHSMAVIALLDEDDLNIMGITLPGHRKGLLAGSSRLRTTSNNSVLAESATEEAPVAPAMAAAAAPSVVPVATNTSSLPPQKPKRPVTSGRPLPQTPPQL